MSVENHNFNREIIHKGIDQFSPKTIQEINEITQESVLKVKEEKIIGKTKFLTKFNPAEQSFVDLTEQSAKEFYKERFIGLGLAPDQVDNLPKPLYLTKIPEMGMRGMFDPLLNYLAVRANPARRDMVDIACSLTHEMSHALAKTKSYFFWSGTDKKPKLDDQMDILGLIDLVHRKGKAVILEESLTNMNMMEFFEKKISRFAPDIIEQRKKILDTSQAIKVLEKLEKSAFGPVDKNKVLPFVNHEFFKPPFLGIKIGLPYMDELAFMTFRFGEELCKTVGYSLHKDQLSGQTSQKLSDAELIKAGRDFLDKSRFIGSREGLLKIVQVFGIQPTKIIFNADNDFKGFNKAMTVVRSKQKQLGIHSD